MLLIGIVLCKNPINIRGKKIMHFIYNGQERKNKLSRFWNTVQPQRKAILSHLSVLHKTNVLLWFFSLSSNSSVTPINLTMWTQTCMLDKCCYMFQLALDDWWQMSAHSSTSTYSNDKLSVRRYTSCRNNGNVHTSMNQLLQFCSWTLRHSWCNTLW